MNKRTMTNRRPLIRQFETGYPDVADALAGTPAEDLDRRPADGGWTAREVVHNLADMETHAFVRLRRLIAEDHPTIDPHDDEEYVRRLHYDRSIQPSLEVVRVVRIGSLQLLTALAPEEWMCWGHHPTIGRYAV